MGIQIKMLRRRKELTPIDVFQKRVPELAVQTGRVHG